MTLQLISQAAQMPVSLAELRDFLKISHQSEDALIAGYIRAATGACENFTGRKLINQQWQMTLNDWGSNIIDIPLTPVLSLDKIEYWTDAAFSEISAGNYLLDKDSFGPRIMPAAGFIWPDPDRDVEGIRITVTAGFGSSQNEVPHDIRLGILHWIASIYDEAGAGQAAIMAEKLWQPYRRLAL